jgi:hypothetical protein
MDGGFPDYEKRMLFLKNTRKKQTKQIPRNNLLESLLVNKSHFFYEKY